ncbi:MAG: hypothetical protein FWG12_08035, partial [Holophagaceae bacterium]|nr:hypothetical protein [Holophagaceae bacterium]
MLRYLYILLFATSLFSQMSNPWEFTDAAFLRRILVQYYDTEKQAVIYLHQGGLNEAEVDPTTFQVIVTGPEEKNVNLRGFVRRSLGEHYTNQGLDDRIISSEQYEIACNVFGLEPRPNRAMLILYFNGSVTQVLFDEERTQLLPELRKLGWEPFKERLKGFLERNPYNVEAHGQIMMDATDGTISLRSEALRALRGQDAVAAAGGGEQAVSNDDAVKSYINAIKMINEAGSLEWSYGYHDAGIRVVMGDLPYVSMLTENPEFQRELARLIELYEKDMLRYPYSSGRLTDWLLFLNLAKKPDPMKLLGKLAFPPDNKKISLYSPTIFSPLLKYPRLPQSIFDDKANYAFKLVDDITDWMEERDPDFLDGIFSTSYARLAGEKARFLLLCKRISELQAYLTGLRNKSGANWPELAKEIKGWFWANFWNQVSPEIPEFEMNQIERILESPPVPQAERKPTTYGIHIFHNLSGPTLGKLTAVLSRDRGLLTQDSSLSPNSWTLYNSKSLIASGSIKTIEDGKDNENSDSEMQEIYELIRNEEYKNLDALERFIRLNPDCHEAMEMYCQQAEKFLPNGEIERNMFNYSSTASTPISHQAYSKMEDKENWSRLASRMVREGLAKLGNSPSRGGRDMRNPWLRLHLWEEMDAGKNVINWHGFMKNTEFWYDKSYYARMSIMPEPVFVKYLHQAERANDWEAVLSACRARFYWNKEQCENDRLCED